MGSAGSFVFKGLASFAKPWMRDQLERSRQGRSYGFATVTKFSFMETLFAPCVIDSLL
jgi:hypothetical protein